METKNETAPTVETLSVCIPFPGFYESWLSSEIDATEEYLADCFAEEPDRYELPAGVTRELIAEHLWDCVNYGAVEKELAHAWADTFADYLNEYAKPADEAAYTFTFEEMTSPREYNFTTDRVFCLLPLADLARMRDAVSPGTWAEVLRERFTSRSGFISFYSNDAEEWDSKPLAEWDHNETGTLLVAYIRDNLEPDHDKNEIEYRVFLAMLDDGDSPFCSAVSDAIDYAKLRDRLTDAMAAAA